MSLLTKHVLVMLSAQYLAPLSEAVTYTLRFLFLLFLSFFKQLKEARVS